MDYFSLKSSGVLENADGQMLFYDLVVFKCFPSYSTISS